MNFSQETQGTCMLGLNKGILIAIEGIDGSGKSTLAKNIFTALSEKQFSVILTKEPGGTALGKRLRKTLQEKDVPVCSKAEYLLFASDRAQHFEELIIPALDQKKIVISDRMSDSSIVYQGFGRGLDIEMLKKINAWAMQNRTPDITLFIDIPLATALERLRSRNLQLTSFEKESEAFTSKLVHGFATLYKDRADILRMDGTQSPEKLSAQAVDYLLNRFALAQ